MHNGSNVEIFDYNSSVTYKCDHNFSLSGEASIHCTTKDNMNRVWNGSAPECEDQCRTNRRLRRPVPRDTNGREVTYRCSDGSVKNPGPGIDTHFGIPGIAIVIVGIAIVIAGIAIGTFAALNKKWQKKKGSYGVNLDSRKHHITTEHDLEM
ncbi:complement receptor type 2-like [Emys orbicularis]|uniref:complement receptor type 2-like n=1 Tax=Emys orbicularis TaxID=82168 RepID=UPI0031FD7F53